MRWAAVIGGTVVVVAFSLVALVWQTMEVQREGSLASSIRNKYVIQNSNPGNDAPTTEAGQSISLEFRGERVREYEGQRIFQQDQPQQKEHNGNYSIDMKLHPPDQQDQKMDAGTRNVYCHKWTIIATAYDQPTEAVLRAARVDGWCTVIVGNIDTPQEFRTQLADALATAAMTPKSSTNKKNKNMQQSSSTPLPPHVHFLSVSDQHAWLKREQQEGIISGKVGAGNAVAAFLTFILRDNNHHDFGRKNLAYLYAIQHGARLIFDLDNDHLLPLYTDTATTAASRGRVLPPLTDANVLTNAQLVVTGPIAFNPHPLLMSLPPVETNEGDAIGTVKRRERRWKCSWPRGFPRQDVSNIATHGQIAYDNVTLNIQESVGVMQFSTIKGMTRSRKWHWGMTSSRTNFASVVNTMPSPGALVVPSHAFVPYNAQATIHTKKAFWALLLPCSVPTETISDTLRGYFAQALFRDLGLSVTVLPPDVSIARKQHKGRRHGSRDSVPGTGAEHNLNMNCGTLLEYLSSWESRTNARTLPERMEELWIDLYERDYIGRKDVQLVQLWLAALMEVQYKFPPMMRHRIDHTVLMGQFNYNNPLSDVLFWHQKWREYFNRIVVRGPFLDEQLDDMGRHGIKAYKAEDDKGFYSPMENLMLTLNDFRSVDSVKGVLYLHDDALLNISNIPLGSENIVVPLVLGRTMNSPRTGLDIPGTRQKVASDSFSIQPSGSYTKVNGFESMDWEKLKDSLHPWYHRDRCILPYKSLYDDPRSIKYREKDGSFLVPFHWQADFLYIPTSLADEYAEAAKLLVDHNVFLECAIPKIVDILQQTAHASAVNVSLFTQWQEVRGTLQMLSASPIPVDMVHPFKISNGYEIWSIAFDWLTKTKNPFPVEALPPPLSQNST